MKHISLWTALITPMTPGLKIDYPSLKQLIHEQDQAGNGLLILGSTGEALNIDLETKKKIVDFTLAQNISSPIMIGVGGHNLEAQKQWIMWLENKNIHAYLMVTPLYAKAGDYGQYQWFKTLMDKVSRPVMLYNVPSRTGCSLSVEAVEKLSKHPQFWAIKDAGGSVQSLSLYLRATNKGKVFCGDDALMPEFAQYGSCGLVSVASNVWPIETNLYVEQCLCQNIDSSQLWREACETLFSASNPIPTKAILAFENRIKQKTVMPPLHERDLKSLDPIKVANLKIRAWFESQKRG